MPKHEQTIALTNVDVDTALAIGYQAMKNLSWTVPFAGENKLLGNTPKDWKTNTLQILLTVENNSLTVRSEMTSGESFDMLGKNKKAVTTFIQAFETAKTSIDEDTIAHNKNAINVLREATVKAAAQEEQQAAEIDKAMNLSGSNLYVTYTIIAINVLVFVLMVLDGAGIMATNQYVHIRWGSNYSPLTLSGDWWRLITNVFIHFGIIHLLMNMYCLYMAGVYLEPMLGKIKYTVAYLCTGILASIASLWWHNQGVNSAGASGAIFGMYGLFLALLTTNLIPNAVRQALLQSIGIFVVYNLVYGMKSGVDNAAHVGGLVSGFIIGYIYVYGIKKEKQEQKVQWIIPLVVLLTIGGAYGYLGQNKIDPEQRNAVMNEMKESSYNDTEKFNDKYNEFVELQDKALSVFSDTTIGSDEMLQQKLNQISLPLWQKAELLVKEMQQMDVSTIFHKKADNLSKYLQLRKEEIKVINEMKTPADRQKVQEIRDKIDSVVESLKAS